MKTLKLKSILFSLLAIMAVAVFMTSCEQDTIGELTDEVSSELNINDETTTEETEFQDMIFSGTEVEVSNTKIEINGELSVAFDGNVSGSVSTVSEDGTIDGKVTFINGIMIYETEGGTVELDIMSTTENLTVSENNNTRKATFSKSIDELVEGVHLRYDLSLELQATKVYIALLSSEPFVTNAQHAQSSNGINLRGCSWWDNIRITAAVTVIGGLIGVGCAVIAVGCVPASGYSLGFMTIPCSVAVGACTGFAGGGAAAAGEIVRAWVCDGDVPPPPACMPNGVDVIHAGNGQVNIFWGTVSSANDYDIYLESNGNFTHIGNDSSPPYTFSTVGAGNYCFGVVPICDGLGSVISTGCVSITQTDFSGTGTGLDQQFHNVTFKSTDNRYMVNESDGNNYVYANRSSAGSWEKFSIFMKNDGTFAIRGSNGKYADVDWSAGKKIKFSNTNKNCSDCRFKFVNSGSHKAIKSVATGQFVSSEGTYNTPCLANRAQIGHWEKWTVSGM